MPMYNLIKYSGNYSKKPRILWQYCRDEQALTDAGALDNGTKDIKIMVPLKYLSNFWRTLEMSLINCKINHI